VLAAEHWALAGANLLLSARMRPAASFLVFVAIAACGGSPSRAPTPILDQGTWYIEVHVDSPSISGATGRAGSGTVDLVVGKHTLNFQPLIGRDLSHEATFSVRGRSDVPGALRYEIVLGAAHSDHDNALFEGHAVTADSIVGTWSEAAYCCSASGRFTLWRPRV